MSEPDVVVLERVQFSHEPWIWAFAKDRRDEIAAHFAARRAVTPGLWNGRVLLMHDCARVGATLQGRFFETDFADFVAWRDWGFPGRGVFNCFSMGAIRSSDGAYILGVMGEATANPGHIYFPSGTPDRADIVGDTVDLAGSVLREVAEETGLTITDFEPQPDWTAVLNGPSIALMKLLQAHENAERLREKILRYLSRQENPELADIRIVRARGDFDLNMPEFMTAFLTRALADRACDG